MVETRFQSLTSAKSAYLKRKRKSSCSIMAKLTYNANTKNLLFTNLVFFLISSFCMLLFCKYQFNTLSNKLDYTIRKMEALSIHESFIFHQNKMLALIGKQYLKKDASPFILSDMIPSIPKQHFMIFVFSPVGNFQQRRFVREYWANQTYWQTKQPWKAVFVVFAEKNEEKTKRLFSEAEQHKDLLVLSLDESANEIHQLMVALEWLMRRFTFDYVLKTNDDFFVNVDATMSFLSEKPYSYIRYNEKILNSTTDQKNYRDKASSKDKVVFIASHGTVFKILPLMDWSFPKDTDIDSIEKLIFASGIQTKYIDSFYKVSDACQTSIKHSKKGSKIECLKRYFKNSVF